MAQYISEKQIQKQAWKFYFVAIAWPVYIFGLPWVYAKSGFAVFAFIIFPGIYLFTWMACLMHECWHKYVPNIPNNRFYNVFSYMLVTDPQIYRLLHGYHHSRVHTWDDTEFHPLGRIKNVYAARLYNLMEILLGVIFTFGFQMYIIPRHPRYKDRYKKGEHVVSNLMWILFYGGLGITSAFTFDLKASQVAIPVLVNFWLCSFFIHHAQLIEHGGLIVEGDLKERNMQSRNLKDDSIIEKLFLFLTHGDAREHVLHHTHADIYSRPFPGKVPMPENAVYISLLDYTAVLWNMVTKG